MANIEMMNLQKYLESKQMQQKVNSSNQAKALIKREIVRLEKYMKEELQKYFNSYDPVYPENRDGSTIKSFQVSEPKLVGNAWEVSITFDDILANHPSVIGSEYEDGYTPWLLNAGWRTNMDRKMSIERFTRFEGTNYIKNAVDKFNKSNVNGIQVKVIYGNEDVTDKVYKYGK